MTYDVLQSAPSALPLIERVKESVGALRSVLDNIVVQHPLRES